MPSQIYVYGITLLSRGVMVSGFFNDIPVVIGRKISDISEDFSSFNSISCEGLSTEDRIKVKSALAWAIGIIEKSFPDELRYQCIISYPDWMPLHLLADILDIAQKVGLQPLRFIGNLSAGAIYADSLKLPNSRWLLSSVDDKGVSVTCAEVGDGVIEMLNIKDHFRTSNIDHLGHFEIDSVIESLIETHFAHTYFDSDGNISRYAASDIDYVLIDGVPEKASLDKCNQLISSLLSIPIQSVLIEDRAFAMGCALQAGILSGCVKDTLLLDVTGRAYGFSVEPRQPPPIIQSVDSDVPLLHTIHSLINSHTTIPTKKIECLRITFFSGSSLCLVIHDIYDRHRSNPLTSRICSIEIANNGQSDQDVHVSLTLDIDAENVPYITLEVRCDDHGPIHIETNSSPVIRKPVSILRLHPNEDVEKANVVSSSAQTINVDDYLRQASQLICEGGSAHEAIRLTSKVLLTIQSDEAYFIRGQAKQQLSDYQGAISDYSQCIAIDPQKGMAYYFRADSKNDLGDNQGAITDCSKAIAIDPQMDIAFYLRGFVRNVLGDREGAIADMTAAISIDSQWGAAYYERGTYKFYLGDNEGAITDFNKAIEIDPQNAEPYYMRGGSKGHLGDREGAITDLSKAIEIDPQHSDAYYVRGCSKYEVGDMEGAIADFNQAIVISPQNPLAYHWRGAAKQELGDKQGALADYRQAIAIDPELENPLIADLDLQQPENALDHLAPIYISAREASVGVNKSISINDEGIIVVTVPPGSREGQKLRIKGKGNFQPGAGRRGDLYLQIVLKEEEAEIPCTPEEVERIAREARIFDGTTVFNKVLGFIRDDNASAQSSVNDSKKAISILSTAGAVGAAVAGLGPLAGLISLGRFAPSSSNSLPWSPKEIDEIKEIFDATQKEVKSITSRFGQSLGRFVHKDGNDFYIFSVFHLQARGFTMITLAQAHAYAKCFLDEKTHQLIASVLTNESQDLYDELCSSLYPSGKTPIKGIRLVKPEDAQSGDTNYNLLCDIGEAYRFDMTDGGSFFGYKVPIPVHSDF
jgi:tetratricopeptide (TPR) repeat protein